MRNKYGFLSIVLVLAIMCISLGGFELSSGQVSASEGNVAVETDGNKVFNVMNSVFEEDMNSESPVFSTFISNYGGGCIEGDHLTIFVKGGIDNSDLFESKMSEKGIDSDRFDIVNVNYSYSDLEYQIQSFWDFRDSKLSKGLVWPERVYSAAICQERNCITICVDSELNIYEYPDLVSALSGICYEIVYEDSEPHAIEETTLKPGMEISTGGSIGFRCKLNGNKGIVTAIHTSTFSSYNPIKYNGQTFGSITTDCYGDSSDFCFVKITNSNYTASRTTNTSPSYTLHASHYVTSLPTNYTVYLVGRNSSSARQGQVVNYSGTVPGHGGTDWLICNYSSSSGDSGGCVFAVVDGDNCVIGVHDGTRDNSSKYATKLSRMRLILSGLVIY